MAKLRIFCLTWNIELEEPDEGQLAKFFAASLKHAGAEPDVIAIGIQEGGSRTHYRQIFEKALPGYVCVTKTKFKGVTKSSQIVKFWSESAAQGLYVLVKGAVEDKESKKEEVQAESAKGTKSALSEKGYCYSEVTIDNMRIGFVSTHAEVKQEKRGADFAAIEKYLAERAQDGAFHALFMMGDLNYRVERRASAKDENALKSEMDEIHTLMASGTGRKTLRKRDTWEAPKSGVIHWDWTEFDDQCLPTYKRLKSDKAKAFLKKLEKDDDPDNHDVEALKNLYPLKVSDKGGSNWDFGWLDRIGVANGKDMGKIVQKGLKLSQTFGLYGGNYLLGGDHVPVFATYVFDY